MIILVHLQSRLPSSWKVFMFTVKCVFVCVHVTTSVFVPFSRGKRGGGSSWLSPPRVLLLPAAPQSRRRGTTLTFDLRTHYRVGTMPWWAADWEWNSNRFHLTSAHWDRTLLGQGWRLCGLVCDSQHHVDLTSSVRSHNRCLDDSLHLLRHTEGQHSVWRALIGQSQDVAYLCSQNIKLWEIKLILWVVSIWIISMETSESLTSVSCVNFWIVWSLKSNEHTVYSRISHEGCSPCPQCSSPAGPPTHSHLCLAFQPESRQLGPLTSAAENSRNNTTSEPGSHVQHAGLSILVHNNKCNKRKK